MAKPRSKSLPTAQLPTLPYVSSTRETMTIEEKRRLNSEAPISRLAPEVLSSIFSQVRDDYLAVLSGDEGFCIPFEVVGSELWIGITHVCHHWRELALDTPTLWTRVVSGPGNNKWTREMLLRSKACPLTCIIEDDSSDFDGGRSVLITQLGRCHTLSICSDDLDMYWSSKVDAPHLEHIVLVANRTSTPPFILSDSHLRAPSLRRLSLELCGVDWKSGFLPHLTHLALDKLPIGSLLKCSDLVRILASMPLLEVIYLSRYIQGGGTDFVLDFENVPTRPYWDHLRRLNISDDVINIALFLSRVFLPPGTKFFLNTCDYLYEARPYLPFVFKWFSNHFEQLADFGSVHQSCIRSFTFYQLGDKFTMQGFNEVFFPEQQELDSHALFTFNFYSYPEMLESLCKAVLPLLPVSSIVFLDVSIRNFNLSTLSWLTIFGSAPKLESVRLRTIGHMSFFHALRLHSNGVQPIKSISLIPYSPIDYQVIVDILRKQLELGMRLLEFVFLIVDDCPPPYYALSQLMEVFSYVGLYLGPE